ncbi:hypothetical protein B0T14DRAFT_526755 [Immersiella caudata]|uniref:Transmembrane protein n=1 Tax=Immersiella caudata TaxID=314043 RepID=A0AA39WE50_9PEZI|nr:hypothetical protein B0T14DRAFT_526755 [Immersiella caudata]
MNTNLRFTYPNWTAPPIAQLNFSTNCTIVAAWARTWLSDGVGVDDDATANHFRQALPANLQGIPSDGQLVDWFRTLLAIRKRDRMNNTVLYNSSNPDPWFNVTVNPFTACLENVCQAIPWSGVPDITGPGVMTSAWIQAVLATTFALLSAWEWLLRRKGNVPGRKLQLVFSAFSEALDMFTNGGLILSLCINFAALVLISQRNNVGDGAQLALAHDMAVFSFAACGFPAIVHEEVHKENDKSGSRNLILLINFVLYAVVGNMAPVFSVKFEHTDSWEVYCFWDIIPTERRVTMLVVMIITYVLWTWLLLFFVLPWLLKKHFVKVAGWLKMGRKVVNIYIMAMTAFLMWYMLLTVTVVRQLLLQRSGFGSEDLRMSFGQILSLGTWLPVIIELYYLFKKGLLEARNDGVPDGQAAAKDASSVPPTDTSIDGAGQQSPEVSDEGTGLLLMDMQRSGLSSHRVSNRSVISLESGPEQAPRSITF